MTVGWTSVVLFISLYTEFAQVLGQDYSLAVITDATGYADAYNCLKTQQQVETIFIPISDAADGGNPYAMVANNIIVASNYNLKIQFHANLNGTGFKSGSTQINDALFNLYTSMEGTPFIEVDTIWIPVHQIATQWYGIPIMNIRFLLSAMQAIRDWQLRPGLITSPYDWQVLTNNLNGAGDDVLLCYESIYAGGLGGPTDPNFDDYVPFADFTLPAAKEYWEDVSVCGLTVDYIIYPTGSPNFGRVEPNESRRRTIEKKMKEEKEKRGL